MRCATLSGLCTRIGEWEPDVFKVRARADVALGGALGVSVAWRPDWIVTVVTSLDQRGGGSPVANSSKLVNLVSWQAAGWDVTGNVESRIS
jgi:hypothetical protein